MSKDKEKIQKAINFAVEYCGIGGAHHKAWVIDQMVRALTGCPMIKKTINNSYTYEIQGESEEYTNLVKEAKNGDEGIETYEWDEGIAP